MKTSFLLFLLLLASSSFSFLPSVTTNLAAASVQSKSASSPQASIVEKIVPSSAKHGDVVTIYGRGFGGAQVKVRVAGVLAPLISATGSKVSFLVPSNSPAGAVTVTATNPGGHTGHIAFHILSPFTGKIELQLEESRSVSARIGAEGGSLAATGPGGASFLLTVPPNAIPSNSLREAPTIRMTPISSAGHLPLSRLLGGVHMEPEGMMFREPLTLTMTLPEAVNANEVIGFGYDGHGENTHLHPVSVAGNILTFRISHFSGVGAGTGSGAQVSALASAPTTSLEAGYLNKLQSAENQVKNSVCGGSCDTEEEVQAARTALDQAVIPIFQEWREKVTPFLAAASQSEEDLKRGATEYFRWSRTLQDTTWGMCKKIVGVDKVDCTLLNQHFLSSIDEGVVLLGQAYVAAFQRAHAACDEVRVVLLLADVQLLGLEGKGGVPASEQEVGTLYGCVLMIEADGFPKEVQKEEVVDFKLKLSAKTEGGRRPLPGVDATLNILNCGARLNGQLFLRVITNDSGEAEVQFTAPQNTNCGERNGFKASVPTVFNRVTNEVVALGKDQEFSADVVEQRLRIAPAHVELHPGQMQQFTATTQDGRPVPVEWFASGGSLAADGLYTAGTALGNFRVIAKSTLDSRDFGTASITITGQITVDISPKTAQVVKGQKKQFRASVTGADNPAVIWSVAGVGSISQAGVFSAGSQAGTATVTATSVEDPSKLASAQVRVTEPYRVTIFESTSEFRLVTPMFINEGGKMAGFVNMVEDGRDFGAFFSEGLVTTIGRPLEDANTTFPNGLNEANQVVGEFTTPGFRPTGAFGHAFLWDPERGLTDLERNGVRAAAGEPCPSFRCSVAYDINDAGQVVGNITLSDRGIGFLWQAGSAITIPLLPGARGGSADAINNLGQVVGSSIFIQTSPTFKIWRQGFLWEDLNRDGLAQQEEVEDLGDFIPTDINDLGQMVGFREAFLGAERMASFWEDNVITPLGSLGTGQTQAISLNNLGQVVGFSLLSTNGPNHAFLWQDGVMTDLNELIPADSPVVGFGVDINDKGQIVGYGRKKSTQEDVGLLLTPP